MKKILLLIASLLYAVALLGQSDTAGVRKYVALSFDDGPNTTTTMQALDVMETYGVPGSFFVNGCNINEETIPVLRRAKAYLA